MAKLLSKCVFTQCLTKKQYKFFKTPPPPRSTRRFFFSQASSDLLTQPTELRSKRSSSTLQKDNGVSAFLHLTYSPNANEKGHSRTRRWFFKMQMTEGRRCKIWLHQATLGSTWFLLPPQPLSFIRTKRMLMLGNPCPLSRPSLHEPSDAPRDQTGGWDCVGMEKPACCQRLDASWHTENRRAPREDTGPDTCLYSWPCEDRAVVWTSKRQIT